MAIEIKITIPDQHIQRVLEALTELSGKNIELMVHSENFDGCWSYSYSLKDANETNKQFAIRAIKENIRAMVRLVDYAEDYERYRTEITTISSPVQDVPDEIVE